MTSPLRKASLEPQVQASDAARVARELRHAKWFGPARVLAVHVDRLELELDDDELTPSERRVTARNALAWPYEPAAGDELLALVGPRGAFVIGVLSGTGKTRLSFEGDVELRAEGGTLRLAGDDGVSIDGPAVAIRARAIDLVADAASHIFGTLKKTVRELYVLRAGERHDIVEGASVTHAKTARILTREKVTINGKEIFLG
ncbi:MAG: DUF3540 domain-containing protein [Polyangiaceae bacterium]